MQIFRELSLELIVHFGCAPGLSLCTCLQSNHYSGGKNAIGHSHSSCEIGDVAGVLVACCRPRAFLEVKNSYAWPVFIFARERDLYPDGEDRYVFRGDYEVQYG